MIMRSLLQLKNLPQYVPATSIKDIEDSIWLRVLVQALVIVGIIAVDIAAQTQNSFWAIPSSIVGATWSWYRRRDRNITLKFCIALGMLVALGAFFGRILGNLNDTRRIFWGFSRRCRRRGVYGGVRF